ncbi:MAG: 2-C-methyl-D-erythritol 2,4-cyclodiphosphate synthase [Nitrospiria bacterium]
MRIGIGYDIHQMVPGRPLIIGGVRIPFERGLLGHSDGDVLIHAVADAILGALGLGDIGQHYPDSDPDFKGMASHTILDDMKTLIEEKNHRIENVDAIIIAEAPRLVSFKEKMRAVLAKHLNTDESRVNIKAKTAEKLDAIGRGEGIAVHAVVLLI